ncbi:ACYPI006543 protein [Aphis craccivora]|uniref:ACYPI006543 protein n=1 Tax=Aphis craccivora TaxID=307492 RepID=A0A6G0YBR8_APHCR|nr:ACYPI006543 protein [Aphis craccivora]
MDMLKDSIVKKYKSSLDGWNPLQCMPLDCQCIRENISEDAHSVIAYPYSNNMAELAAIQGPKNIRLIIMYISKTCYFNGDTMKYLVNEMLQCKDVETIEQYYNVLDQNFNMHPPCAQYMDKEYDKLLLGSHRKYFEEMSLWDYIIKLLNQITTGEILYGDNEAYDLAFKNCLSFCICILQIDFEVSKRKNVRPLVAKCLKYHSARKTRMSDITKLLDTLYNTGYDFQVQVIDLALLVNQLK